MLGDVVQGAAETYKGFDPLEVLPPQAIEGPRVAILVTVMGAAAMPADALQPHVAQGIRDVVDAMAVLALQVAVQHHQKMEMRAAGDPVFAFDDEA